MNLLRILFLIGCWGPFEETPCVIRVNINVTQSNRNSKALHALFKSSSRPCEGYWKWGWYWYWYCAWLEFCDSSPCQVLTNYTVTIGAQIHFMLRTIPLMLDQRPKGRWIQPIDGLVINQKEPLLMTLIHQPLPWLPCLVCRSPGRYLVATLQTYQLQERLTSTSFEISSAVQNEVQHWVWTPSSIFGTLLTIVLSDLPVLFPYPRIYPGELPDHIPMDPYWQFLQSNMRMSLFYQQKTYADYAFKLATCAISRVSNALPDLRKSVV